MELELKHLAPYLPYELNYNEIKTFGITSKPIKISSLSLLVNARYRYNEIIIYLRPLSDLTKEIEHDGRKFVPVNCFFREASEMLKKELLITSGRIIPEFLNYQIISKLFEWHFDVFGLIDKGLAIDINEMNNL